VTTSPVDRGAIAALSVAAVAVIVALSIQLILADGPQFIAGILVGVPLGALLGWLADLAIPRIVDWYLNKIRRRRGR
jgi:hypothetical protein